MDNFKQILDSGFYAIVILGILGIMSTIVWGISWLKWKEYRKEKKGNLQFEQAFSKIESFVEVNSLLKNNLNCALADISKKVLEEAARLSPYVSYDSVAHRSSLLEEGIQRAVEEVRIQEERHLSFLAMSASLSPFLGLLGTVWGIMTSFFEIGAQGSAELTVVAPGIASALITTIGGLLVAIPSSAFMNYFSSKGNKNEVQYYNFGSKLLSLFKIGDLKALERTAG